MIRTGFSRLACKLWFAIVVAFCSSQSFASNDMVFICEGDEALHWDKRVGKNSTPEIFDIKDARRKVLISRNTATIFVNEDDWVRVVKQDPGYYSSIDGSTDYTFYGGLGDNFYSFQHKKLHYNEGRKTTLSIGRLQGSTFWIAKYYCS